jgi:hypothetical protein
MMRPLFNKARQFRTVKPSNCDAAKAVLVDRQNLLFCNEGFMGLCVGFCF